MDQDGRNDGYDLTPVARTLQVSIPMSPNDRKSGLEYQLPPLAGAVQAGWQSTLQAAAVVSTLFAGISAQLLVYFKSLDINHVPSRAGQNLILWLCYASLFFNAGATLTSLFLIDVVGELPFRSSHQPHLVTERLDVVINNESKLLKRYGAGRSWSWLRRHWEVCLGMGILSTALQVLIYIGLNEPVSFKISLAILLALVLSPMFLFIPCIRSRVDSN